MDDSLEEPWGLLVAKEGSEDDRVPLLGQEFIIGRAKGNASYPVTKPAGPFYPNHFM